MLKETFAEGQGEPVLQMRTGLALGLLGEGSVVDGLLESTRKAATAYAELDENATERQRLEAEGELVAAITALGYIGDKRALDELCRITVDDDDAFPPAAREAAVVGLGMLGDRSPQPWRLALTLGANYRARTATLPPVSAPGSSTSSDASPLAAASGNGPVSSGPRGDSRAGPLRSRRLRARQARAPPHALVRPPPRSAARHAHRGPRRDHRGLPWRRVSRGWIESWKPAASASGPTRGSPPSGSRPTAPRASRSPSSSPIRDSSGSSEARCSKWRVAPRPSA